MSDVTAIFVISLVLLYSILGMRRSHSREIYIIWYLFSLSLSLFTALNLLAHHSGVDITDVLGPAWARAMKTIYNALTNIWDELWLVGGFVFLAIIPQLLAYLLSGPSGSSSSPILVRRIGTVAILSLVKFLAIWSGIVLSNSLAGVLLGSAAVVRDIKQALATLAFSFMLANVQHRYLDDLFYVRVFPGIRVTVRVPPLQTGFRWLHIWFTRYAEPAETSGFYLPFIASSFGVVQSGVVPTPSMEKEKVRQPEEEWVIGHRWIALVFRGPASIWVRDQYRRLIADARLNSTTLK